MSSDIKRVEQKPLSDADLRTILGASLKILKYSELANVSALSSLLPSGQDYCIILYEQEENSGHWVALLQGSSEGYGYEFFDPYGNNVDVPLKWTDKEDRQELGQTQPYLTKLLEASGERWEHSPYKFEEESKSINTCGHHCAHRIYRMLRNQMDLREYKEYMEHLRDKYRMDYDEVVSEFVQDFTI